MARKQRNIGKIATDEEYAPSSSETDQMMVEPEFEEGGEEEKPAGKSVVDDIGSAFSLPPPPKKSKKSAGVKKVVNTGGGTKLLDDRQLSKKARIQLATEWDDEANRGRNMAGLMRGLVERRQKKTGGSGVFLTNNDKRNMIFGIPCPSLAFEYLIQNDVFPLGIIMQIIATWGVGKSGMLAEFYRWFIMSKGVGCLCENETKFSPEWFSSIIGQEDFENYITIEPSEALEDWQESLTYTIREMKRIIVGTKEAPGPGKRFPVLFGVDSVMGKMTRGSQKDIVDEGFAGRGYAVEALSISRYLKTMPSWFSKWPFSLVLINHLKQSLLDEVKKDRFSGGVQLGFQESLEIIMEKSGKAIDNTQFQGFQVQLTCNKNSLGVTGRKIVTRVIWWEEDDDNGNFRQITKWDWNWATVRLLNTLMHGQFYSAKLRARLAKFEIHLDCPTVSEVENRGWSRNLGMKAKDAMPWDELGKLIHENPEMMSRLRQALLIRNRQPLQGNFDEQYKQMLNEMP